MPRTSPSRVSATRILADLRAAARTGDRAALAIAIDQMKTLALSPRYWERYLLLLGNPFARLVDLLVIKQGERIARQKGWTRPRPSRAAPSGSKTRGAAPGRSTKRRGRPSARRPGPRPTDEGQPMLFDLR